MNHSGETKELFSALAKAQGAMRAAPKLKTNPHFKSSYADLPALWEVARQTLSENGLALLQLPRHVPEGGICIETVLTHSSGQFISDEGLFVPATKQDAQGYGSAMTYARRYSMGALLGMVSDEDDDGNAASKPAPVSKLPTKDLADFLAAAEVAESKDDLNKLYKAAAQACRDFGDIGSANQIKAACAKRAEALKETA